MSWRLSLVVLAVVLANLIFGLDWYSASKAPPRSATTVESRVALPQPPPLPDEPPAAEPAPAPLAQAIDKPAAPACNVSACEDAYRSFRASDCTYQPTRGERRRCTKR